MSPAENAARFETAVCVMAIEPTDALDSAIVRHQLLPVLLEAGAFVDDAELAATYNVAHTTVARRRVILAKRYLPDADICAIGAIYTGRRAGRAKARGR